jgi:hypothetical protein
MGPISQTSGCLHKTCMATITNLNLTLRASVEEQTAQLTINRMSGRLTKQEEDMPPKVRDSSTTTTTNQTKIFTTQITICVAAEVEGEEVRLTLEYQSIIESKIYCY